MADNEIDLTGLSRRFGVAVSAIRAAAPGALYEEGLAIMADSQSNYVPVDEGVLRASGHVTPPQTMGDETTVTLSFGGAAAPYAIAVHEHLGEHSPRSWRVAEAAGRPVQFHPSDRGPKYLERPLLKAQEGFVSRLAERIRRAI